MCASKLNLQEVHRFSIIIIDLNYQWLSLLLALKRLYGHGTESDPIQRCSF
jgi:hypothetical protein